MKYENNFYCINYSESDNEYITDLIDAINSNLSRIMTFFKIHKFNQKKSINIWSNLDDYITYLKPFVNEYYDWIVADTFDNNINILSYDLYLTGPHKNSNISDYKKIIIHELVHSCQQEVNPDARNVTWFWEALATNLSNQQLRIVDISYSKNDIMYNFRSLHDSYSVSYTIGRYIIENFKNSQILEYVKYPDKLISDAETIFEKTKCWVHTKHAMFS